MSRQKLTKRSRRIRSVPEGLWTYCSVDTKKKIEDFFTENKGFKITVNPIFIRGIRMFSYYEFANSKEQSNMLIITRSGIQLIDKLCRELSSEKEVQWAIYNHFVQHLKVTQYDLLMKVSRIIPILANHYFKHKNNLTIYSSDKVNRYLCVLYPLTHDALKGLNHTLVQINNKKEDEVLKDRICFY